MLVKLKSYFRKIIWRLSYTGERVVPTQMQKDTKTLTQHIARYIFALEYAVNKEVLDAACGTGYGTALLSLVASNVTGIDIDRETIIWARSNNIFYSPVILLSSNLEKEPLPKKYDLIISFETIEHLNDPRMFIKRVTDNLTPLGLFVFSIPLSKLPNKFHQHVFDWPTTIQLFGEFKININWYSQVGQNINKGIDPYAEFAIGLLKMHE